jgi:hypothetical protein
MSLMLFYMADSFHSARTPKLRLAHLKQISPIRRAGRFPLFKSSTRLAELAALALRAFCAVSTGELPFPVWKEKLQCKPIFLSNSGIEEFPERISGKQSLAQPKRRRPATSELN